MKLRVFASSVIVAGLLLSGCTTQPEGTGSTPSAKVLTEPTAHVKGLIEKFKLCGCRNEWLRGGSVRVPTRIPAPA